MPDHDVVPRKMQEQIFIHVGFSNTGTTSLQRNFFSRRSDIFFAGEPYGERGGIFSAIKSIEEFNFDMKYINASRDELIASKSQGRTIVISDESLSDPPQLYISPYVMPRDVVALRLYHMFPSAKIIFTIRDQRRYVASMYLNLKRNSARFDRVPIPPFSHWLTRHLMQPRSHFLQNLNFIETVRLYENLFGHDNICMLPIELLLSEGAQQYLGRLCQFMGIDLHERNVVDYEQVHNRRMSVRQEIVAELLVQDRFSQLLAELDQNMGNGQLDAILEDGPRASVELSPADEQKIRQRVEIGNWLLVRDFGLDLERWGYPLPNETVSPEQLKIAEQELHFRHSMEALHQAGQSAEAVELRRSAEIASLRSRLQDIGCELDRVGASPIWRAVRRIDGARRSLSRAAAMILGARPKIN
jgi:hypothetical protein